MKAYKNIGELRDGIKAAERVYIQPRFGTNESWVRISKREAFELLEPYNNSDGPQYLEMGGDLVGTGQGFGDGFVQRVVWIGG